MNLFAQTDGRWFVDERKYAMTLGDASLNVYNWGTVVKVGTEVEMAIVVQQTGHSYPVVCTICLVNNASTKNARGHLTW